MYISRAAANLPISRGMFQTYSALGTTEGRREESKAYEEDDGRRVR
jgi:hypothetical protein